MAPTIQTMIRVQHGKDNPYMLYLRKTAQDKRLSYEARGLHVYLMSKPDNWQVQINDLMIDDIAGRDKVQKLIKELAELGYIKRPQRYHDPKTGNWKWTPHIVYESPLTDFQSMDHQSMDSQSILDKTDLENKENDLSDFANAQSDMRHANANDDILPLSDNERDSAVLPLDDHMATPPRPTPAKSSKPKEAKPKKERPQNPLYNAMRDDYFMGGEGFNLNKSLKELKVFDDLKPEYIKPFAAWYDAKNPGMTRPGWSKIADHYGKWLKAGKPGLTTSTSPAIGVPKWMKSSQEQYND